MNSLEKLREELKKKQNNQKGTGNDNALYPFWNAKDGTTSVIRFLPDGDESNPFFWRERRVITLPFDGVLGDDTYNGKTVEVKVPCVKMYDNTARCPVLEEINKYWKTELEPVARKYWPKKSFLMQGIVRESPEFMKGKEDNPPENPIRRFTINKKLFENIEKAIMDPDMENLPTHYDNGVDFRIIKTQQGEYASYATSMFARKESPLTEKEKEDIESYGLSELNNFIPQRPSEDGMAIIEEMFHASLNGEPYDPSWAEFYRPYGMEFGNTSTGTSRKSSSTNKEDTKESTGNDKPPFEPDDKNQSNENDEDDNSSSTDDVLAELKNRIQNSNS